MLTPLSHLATTRYKAGEDREGGFSQGCWGGDKAEPWGVRRRRLETTPGEGKMSLLWRQCNIRDAIQYPEGTAYKDLAATRPLYIAREAVM
jgi:hypothetical protein